MNSSQRHALIAFLGGLSLFLSTIEYLFPKPVPFFRLGLANLPILLSLGVLNWREILLLSVFKVLGQGLVNGTLASYVFLFSVGGTASSVAVMYGFYRLFPRRSGYIGISLMGALASNLVQVWLSLYFIFGTSAWVIVPYFLGMGSATGLVMGIFSTIFAARSRWFADFVGAFGIRPSGLPGAPSLAPAGQPQQPGQTRSPAQTYPVSKARPTGHPDGTSPHSAGSESGTRTENMALHDDIGAPLPDSAATSGPSAMHDGARAKSVESGGQPDLVGAGADLKPRKRQENPKRQRAALRRKRQQGWLVRNTNPQIIFILGLAGLVLFTFQSNLLFRSIQVLVLFALGTASGKNIRIAYFFVLVASISLFGLLQPAGQLLFEVAGLAVTLGALEQGAFRGLTLAGFVFTSLVMVQPHLQLPGQIGRTISSIFAYYESLNRYRGSIGFRSFIPALDAVLFAVFRSGAGGETPDHDEEDGPVETSEEDPGKGRRGWPAYLAAGGTLALFAVFLVLDLASRSP